MTGTVEQDLAALAADEVVTEAYSRDVPLPDGGVLVLVTVDNGRDHKRPNTFGPRSLAALERELLAAKARAARGEIRGLAVTGKPFILGAGADLSQVGVVPDRATAKRIVSTGHRVLGMLGELGVPSFCFINGLTLGGALELALNADYRTVAESVPAIAFPEVFLGLIPGWGGCFLLPNLIGIENALRVIVENPLKQKTLTGPQAFELGIADVLLPSASFLERSIAWAGDVLAGRVKVERPHAPGRLERLAKWDIAIGVARKQLESRIGTVPRSPYVALDLLKGAKRATKAEGFAAEDEALADLIAGDQFAASMYAFDLTQKRARKPAGAPDAALAKKVTKVGVIGAGLMASQFALLFARRLKVPVQITDLDQARVDAGIARIHEEIGTLLGRGRVNQDEANRLTASITGTTDLADFADCDWVIEAVFEELSVKQQVFADVEPHLSPEAVLATNTSSLSVEAIGARLQHPARVVGFHFFNPVAVMPLIEVVRTPATDDATLSTAMTVARTLKKNAVIVRDAPGFVVNRILAKVLGEAMHAVDTGTPFPVVDRALDAFGLPMSPFELLDLVGLQVGAHVLDTHHAAFPERFFDSANLHALADAGVLLAKDDTGTVKGFDKRAIAIVQRTVPKGATPLTAEQFRERVEDGLADEIHRMLEDGVVAAPEDIDLCLVLGAGYPFQAGGITPYLDRVGASERAFGATFHSPPIRGAASRS
ncbi:3-hydroxyacyl-CoA dehydrogenase NAD-binding domain-containing protein [Amnibacterium sp. CER49]|uniref:3-hydroxyacyl-CoA dehydrogenase NAD-binding domain-containing protein n=1 Tax=Amnibacterium sp. CER49 TaxID=3039161 RepID=UPI00244CF339|nr:3-hydroxyacyl-CoA dehydrogenase NAD-binding domain-containing protein [Amnibacterium sp. CER49]MDH2444278.1 3-hydroxyacyl-CoA dehydrogenase NAD-binding domain-containing protein [Amnibacterium sp. CER49]